MKKIHKINDKNKKQKGYNMGIDTFKLMNTGMTYEQAINFEIKICIIILIIVGTLYILKFIIKKFFPKLYEKLKQYNIF